MVPVVPDVVRASCSCILNLSFDLATKNAPIKVRAMVPSQKTISVLPVCRRTMASELYTQALKRRGCFQVFACSETVSDALRAVRAHEIDVALISSTLNDGLHSGFVALQQIHETFPDIKCVILLERNEGHLVTAAFHAGAMGIFFPANEDFKSLCRCVKQVDAGQVWANGAQLRELLEAFSRCAPIQVVNAGGEQLLTKREVEVVRLVADGLTNRQIGKELQLSEHTVRNNLFRIFDKLGVSTRVELALYAINHSKLVLTDVVSGGLEAPIAHTSEFRSATAQKSTRRGLPEVVSQ